VGVFDVEVGQVIGPKVGDVEEHVFAGIDWERPGIAIESLVSPLMMKI
jgi:hypothetical protein